MISLHNLRYDPAEVKLSPEIRTTLHKYTFGLPWIYVMFGIRLVKQWWKHVA